MCLYVSVSAVEDLRFWDRARRCPHHDSGPGNQPMEGTRITKGTKVQRYRGTEDAHTMTEVQGTSLWRAPE